jgi:hypothetical protein
MFWDLKKIVIKSIAGVVAFVTSALSQSADEEAENVKGFPLLKTTNLHEPLMESGHDEDALCPV